MLLVLVLGCGESETCYATHEYCSGSVGQCDYCVDADDRWEWRCDDGWSTPDGPQAADLLLCHCTPEVCGLTTSTPTLPDCREGCCKVCDEGKACGDSCIDKLLACNEGEGCACDSWEACR